jgi:aspartyl/asparaginyl-tRNA synthetase
MFELLRPYFMIAKLSGFILLLITVVGYVALLKYQLSDQQETIDFLRETVKTCDQDRSKLRAVTRVQARNLDVLDAYYTNRKCLNLHDGALTEDELDLK